MGIDASPVFAFGTLQDADVLSCVLGRPATPGCDVRLPHHAPFTVHDERFPVLRGAPGDRADGRLMTTASSGPAANAGRCRGGSAPENPPSWTMSCGG